MRVFISGPMRGYDFHNYPAFDLAQSQLESLGFEVVNPAEIGRHYGIDEYTHPDRDTIKTLLLADLEALAYCDAILLLPGHERSDGSHIEEVFGEYFGIPAFESITDLLVHREGKAA